MKARKPRLALAVLGAGALLAFAAPAASADVSSSYAPDTDSRTFATGAGGWTGQTVYTNGLCIAGVTCPTVSNQFVATDGAGGAGDGYIQNNLAGIASLLSTTTATFTSPEFTYNGAQGKVPSSVRFEIDRRSNAAALLGLLSSANYSVFLDDLTAGGSVTAIPSSTITNLVTWTKNAPVQLNPSQLTVGHRYRIRIATQLDLPVAVIPSATFDYDNVALTATAGGSGSLADDLKNGVLGGAATLRGNRLFVPVRCPKTAPAKCRVKLIGYLKGRKSKRATGTGKVKVKPGKKKVAVLRVKPRLLSRVQSKKKMVFRAKVKSGPTKVTFFKKLRIIRR